ncbi:Uncharacterised protein [Candidatus Bilamarchaeum dharawalense]|uniref:Uncharacterized protein n=1 Tax=Candidatus Bilamarchaeum dharawalense TaxID=2885759 RepID=A0A5E4LQW6_9ARCH|nr:Uncharacterised protein [Candidatus Bilamarchaeum dharawalense]
MTRIYRDANVDRQLGKPPEVSKRPYFQATTRFVSSVVLGTALAFGVVGTTGLMLTPRAAMAQGSEITLGSMVIDKIDMAESLQNLKTQSLRYVRSEGVDPTTRNYSNLILVPGQFGTVFVLSADGTSGTAVKFPKEGQEKQWYGDFTKFRKAVEEYTGRTLEKMTTVIEVYTDPRTKEVALTAYGFPLDQNGNPIRYKNGYLGVAVSLYTKTGEVVAAAGVMLEPGMELAKR